MSIKTFLCGLSLLIPAIAAAQYPMTIASLPPTSGFSSDYDPQTGVWTLTCENNAGGLYIPSFRMNAIEEAVPAEYTSFCFEYRSTDELPKVTMTMYKIFLGSAQRNVEFSKPLHATQEWQTYRVDVSEYRKSNSVRFLNKAAQYQDVQFPDLPVGGAIQIRNIRYDVNEYSFKDITLLPGVESTIEAEDFNSSADGKEGRIAHHNQVPEMNTYYRHPTGDYFPIYAWGSVDFVGSKGDEAPLFLQQQYQELWDCGFTITQGTAWPGVDYAFLFDGQEINGVQVNLHEGTDLKYICKAGTNGYGEISSVVPKNMASDRLAGWFIMDEPHHFQFPEMKQKVDWIRQFDQKSILYGNLLNISTSMPAIGFTNYDEYVHTYMSEVGTGFISYDYYPVRQYDDTKEIYIEPDFFQNLEIVSKLAKYYGTSFWAFAHSVASNCGKAGVSYPTPEEDHVRVQIFGNLAYGAQGVQYFTYKCPTPYGGYVYYDAPISLDNEKTPVWYMVQRINKDIHALTWVFLGAEFIRAGHTNAETPVGCSRLTAQMLPDGVKSVESDGQGVCVTLLKNGKNLFMMVLNGDIHNTQNVTVTTDAKLKRVLMNGETADQAAGTETYALTPGHFLLYLVSENEPETDKTPTARYTTSDYRTDADGLFLSEDASASGGHYIAAMGDPSWRNFSGLVNSEADRILSRTQASQQWGAMYSYTVNVPTDMDVDIFVSRAVPADEYFRVTATGVEPGYEYTVEGDPTLNWPRKYAASMTLEIDGTEVAPSYQRTRPDAQGDATLFDTLIADKDSWISTAEADGSVSNTLYFWPESSTDNGSTFIMSEKPDYEKVHLTAGTHKIAVNSLSYPWHFDRLVIKPTNPVNVANVLTETPDDRVFDLMGVECKGELAPGIYVRGGKKFIVK